MPQEANQFLSQYLSAFPDAQTTVEDLLADGAKVVARVSIRATHRGAF
jgi:predicted ester cyclase